MKKRGARSYFKFSPFIYKVVIILLVCVIATITYCILSNIQCIRSWLNSCANDKKASIILCAVSFGFVFLIATLYGGYSLLRLLSRKAIDDERVHCLPIVLAPLFLIVENALLHICVAIGHNTENKDIFYFENDPYYEILMGIFSTLTLTIVTFASLKYAFEISNKHQRYIETSSVKPDILIKNNSDGYSVLITRNDCYLCGLYVGDIKRVLYRDIKRAGNIFFMHDIYFPNRKVLYNKINCYKDLRFSGMGEAIENDFNEHISKEYPTFCIFRDMQNYYYLAKLPKDEDEYCVIGVNEETIMRLLIEFNKGMAKRKKVTSKKERAIKYKAMDWFKVPYNFCADNDQKAHIDQNIS